MKPNIGQVCKYSPIILVFIAFFASCATSESNTSHRANTSSKSDTSNTAPERRAIFGGDNYEVISTRLVHATDDVTLYAAENVFVKPLIDALSLFIAQKEMLDTLYEIDDPNPITCIVVRSNNSDNGFLPTGYFKSFAYFYPSDFSKYKERIESGEEFTDWHKDSLSKNNSDFQIVINQHSGNVLDTLIHEYAHRVQFEWRYDRQWNKGNFPAVSLTNAYRFIQEGIATYYETTASVEPFCELSHSEVAARLLHWPEEGDVSYYDLAYAFVFFAENRSKGFIENFVKADIDVDVYAKSEDDAHRLVNDTAGYNVIANFLHSYNAELCGIPSFDFRDDREYRVQLEEITRRS